MKILACLDLSNQAQAVLEKATELAKHQKAELILYTVAQDFLDFGEGAPLALTEQVKEQSQQALEAARGKVQGLGLQARAVLDSGPSPADAILTFAAKEGVDLIVVGSRAKTGLDRFLIGSVASKVVDHSHCSVLVLR